MSVRLKILSIITLTIVCLIAAICISAAIILYRQTDRYEERLAAQMVNRTRDAVQSELAGLSDLSTDWAGWDDMCKFAQDGNKSFIEANLADEMYVKNRLSHALVLNRAGQKVFFRAYDERTEMRANLSSPDIETALANTRYLLPSGQQQAVTSGVLVARDVILMVVARPILTSQYKGPSAGTLVFGRLLSPSVVARLAELTHQSIAIYRLDDPSVSSELRSTASSRPAFTVQKTPREMICEGVIADLHGRPALVFATKAPRDYYRQFRASLEYILLSLVITGVVFGVLMMALVDRLLLSRLSRLDAFVKGVTSTDNLAGRVTIPGGDEVASLAGAVNDMLGSLQRDLALREKAEEALRESEERYHSLFTRSLDCVCVHDFSGQLLDANGTALSLLGYTRNDIPKIGFGSLFAEDQIPLAFKTMREVIETGHQKVPDSLHLRHRDGHTIAVEATASLIYHGGEPYAVQVVGRDVTERLRVEKALEASEHQLREVIDAAPYGAIVHEVTADGQMIMQSANQSASTIFGTDLNRFVGHRIDELWPEIENTWLPGAFRRVVETGERFTGEFEHDFGVGTRTFDFHIISLGSSRVAAFCRDTTESKRLEERLLQTQKMEAVGELAGGIAHDFNNLLTGILGHANLLKLDLPVGSQAHDAAKTIERAAERATELTQQILGFARKGKNQEVQIDIHALVREVSVLLGRTLNKNISITLRLHAENPFVLGDPGQMQQALLNLTVNARDAMPNGGELTISTDEVDFGPDDSRKHPAAAPGRRLVLSVADTGSGIPPEIRDRIFDPYFTTKGQGKGTGLGLAMIYGIVRNHGGWINLESEVDQGSVFRVSLPQADRDAVGAAAPAPDVEAPRRGTGRILLVDDEAVVRETAAQMLTRLGYEVTEASDGKQGLDIYGRERGDFHLVILDMIMPEMDGRDCYRAIKSVNPGVRALLSTGYALDREAQSLLDEGMQGFIQKPYRIGELAEAVAVAMQLG